MTHNSDLSFGLICFAEAAPPDAEQVPPVPMSERDVVYEMIRRNTSDLPEEVVMSFVEEIVNPNWSASASDVGCVALSEVNHGSVNTNH